MKKIFFGWFIITAALFLTTYNSAMFIYGFTAFMTPIAATLGWSYAQISLASSIRGLETGTLDPLIGLAVDRWPARRLMLIGIIIFTLGAIVISQATNLAMFYIGFLIVGLGSATSITMVPTTVMARWFKRNIGKASGILATGMAIGGLFAPLLVKAIDTYTWQTTMLYLAAGMLILGVPLSFLFRDRPEDMGLLADGKAPTDVRSSRLPDFSIDVKEALRTRSFWHIGLTYTFQMMAIQAVALHMMPHLTSLGLERSTAAVTVTIFSVVSLVARLLYGILADIFSKRYIMALSNGLTTTGLVIFGSLDGSSFAMVALFAATYGIGAGGATPLRAPVIREYFGIKNFGAIFGLLAVFITAGTIVGAPLAGWVFDVRGTYNPIWFVLSGLTMIGTILSLIMPPPASRNSSPVVS